jgi:hypothetical protein
MENSGKLKTVKFYSGEVTPLEMPAIQIGKNILVN